MPRVDLDACGERFGAARQERTQRQDEHLLQTAGSIRQPLAPGVSVDAGGRVVPARDERLERVAVAPQLDRLINNAV